MNGLKILLTDMERNDVNVAIQRLFAFQDRPLSKDKLAMFLEEIGSRGYPYPAIMASLSWLEKQELNSIKLSKIIEAIENRIIREPVEYRGCDICWRTGFISMVDEKQYSFAFACQCERGSQKAKNLHMVQWNGKNIQYINGKKYILYWAHLIKGGDIA